jgi:hypothetical protein
MHTYNLGSGVQPIQLMVDISTLGLAASRAILVEVNSSMPGVSVAHSNDATGDIPATGIGAPVNLKNKRLSIFTKVDIIGDELETRKKEFEGITARYTLSNGPDGEVVFSDPQKTIDQNYFSALIHQHIDLI